VLGLAPSAAAAAALAEATGMPCETLAKLTHDLAHVPASDLVASIGPGTPADERTMAGPVPHNDWEAAYHRMLDLAAARKPLPVDHPTAALAYRVKDLATSRKQRRTATSIDPFPRPSRQQSGPSLGF